MRMKNLFNYKSITQKIFAKDHKFFFLCLLFFAIVAESIMFPVSSDIRFVAVIGFYLYLAKQYNLKSQATFIFVLFLFLFSYIFYVFTQTSAFYQTTSPATEKAAVWVFLFFVLGVIQKWRE